MSKRGNYFIAMYDINDNYIRDFESIEECALFFKEKRKNINDYILRKRKILNKYQLFKIKDIDQNINFNKERKR